MLRVTVRVQGAPTVVLGTGERLAFGRAPEEGRPQGRQADPRRSLLTLPRCTQHVSRLMGELTVGEELVRLSFYGSSEAQLSSLFDAPGGARRATLTGGMSALLDEGENQLLLLRGRAVDAGGYADLLVVVDVTAELPPGTAPQPLPEWAAERLPAMAAGEATPAITHSRDARTRDDANATASAPGLERESREWFVALALAEPWLTGADDYPRPPSNREVYERIRDWRGYAWNLERAQRVDEAVRSIAGIAFGPLEDPFRPQPGRRVSNVRFAVGKRIAETRLVTAEDLRAVEKAATTRLHKAEISTVVRLPETRSRP